MTQRTGHPFLKWAGGKTQLLPHLLAAFDDATRQSGQQALTYFEPFLGGAALYWALASSRSRYLTSAWLNDSNERLIQTYAILRDRPDALMDELGRLDAEYNADAVVERRDAMYYRRREEFNATRGTAGTDVRSAALLIFLNRTCYNGLFRLNRLGGFNVPHGRYRRPLICDRELLSTDAALLGERTELSSADFAAVVTVACADTSFVYLDPPYVPLSATSNFTAYQGEPFDLAAQERLARLFAELAGRGVWVVASNSSSPVAVELYASVGAHIYLVPAARAINSKGAGRGPIPELIATSFPCPALEEFAVHAAVA